MSAVVCKPPTGIGLNAGFEPARHGRAVMRRFMSSRLPRLFLSQVVTLAMTLAPVVGVQPAMAAPGGVLQNGVGSAPAGVIIPGFLFEPEFPVQSLKTVPTWNEVEQLLDNPYAMALDATTPGNDQGFPSYRTTINRRPSFGVTLPQFLIHPLNYNTNIGEEMRLVNPDYPGGTWQVPDTECSTAPAGRTWPPGCVPPRPPVRRRGRRRTRTGSRR